jgi:hypothetical protein
LEAVVIHGEGDEPGCGELRVGVGKAAVARGAVRELMFEFVVEFDGEGDEGEGEKGGKWEGFVRSSCGVSWGHAGNTHTLGKSRQIEEV